MIGRGDDRIESSCLSPIVMHAGMQYEMSELEKVIWPPYIGQPILATPGMNIDKALDEVEKMELLDEREKTHGPYAKRSETSQSLKLIAQSSTRWFDMTDSERESVDMILHKLSRILEGDPHFPDHWEDIAGYANCALRTLTPEGDE